jgi:DNA processing protein
MSEGVFFMTREEYRYWLANIHNIGARKIEMLLQFFGDAEGVYNGSKKDLEKFKEEYAFGLRMSDTDIEAIYNSRDPEKIQHGYDRIKKNSISFVSKEEERYPSKLRNIFGAPYALYVKGSLPREEDKVLAVVGARDCSPYGKEMAKYLTTAVAREGIAIVSGLARGIDAFAHEGALIAGGLTYGIMGCGIDICYPKENINLYMEMQKEGGIISEYAPGMQPFAGNFPMRNRIISGLCDGILVIEAKEKSGSLITVDMGLEQGKDIYALPGRVTDRLSGGCNNLIKMGAKLVTTPKDILEDFIPNYEQNMDELKKNNKLLESNGKIVYASLCLEPKHIEEIAIQTGLSMDLLMEQLLLLELRGFVKQTMKNYYVAQD